VLALHARANARVGTTDTRKVSGSPRCGRLERTAAWHQKRRRRWLARRGRSALAAEACDCELQNAQFVPQQQSARHPPGLSQNGALRRPHHMRPQLPDSGGCRSATNREQRCAALGAVALPAGTTVWQGHLPRVGDGDLFAADASALWVGLRCLWVPGARFNHGQAAYSRPLAFPRALPINPGGLGGRSIRWRGSSVHWVCCEGLSGSCRETVTSVGPPSAHDHCQGSHRSPRSPVGSWTTGGSRRLVSRRVRLSERLAVPRGFPRAGFTMRVNATTIAPIGL
jgi:hypothetical protein